MPDTDLAPELLSAIDIFSVKRRNGVLSREQLEALLALTRQRHVNISPRTFAAVVESHLRSLEGK